MMEGSPRRCLRSDTLRAGNAVNIRTIVYLPKVDMIDARKNVVLGSGKERGFTKLVGLIRLRQT